MNGTVCQDLAVALGNQVVWKMWLFHPIRCSSGVAGLAVHDWTISGGERERYAWQTTTAAMGE